MKKIKILFLISSILLLNNLYIFSQEEDDMFSMSLMDLMNVEVVSASKKAESVFDAPLSTTVITYEEIINSGVSSIPEALRLSPGLIVREKANGVYDVHIRGNDYLPPGSRFQASENSISLVMIDNRVVYSYFQGGTIWESLPIGISDIERIEIIRGPSSALYGPNAVSGVINIITKKVEDEGLKVYANAQAGTFNTKTGSVLAGYGINDKMSLKLSANYQYRNRFDDLFYYNNGDRYVNYDSIQYLTSLMGSLLFDSAELVDQALPYPNRSLNQYGINGTYYFDVNDDIKMDLTWGMQNSEAQTTGLASRVAQGDRISNTNYLNFNSEIHGLNLRVSSLSGEQNLLRESKDFHYDFSHLDVVAEYDYKMGDLSIRPGISYQSATYNADNYIDTALNQGFIHGDNVLSSIGFSLRADYVLKEKTRFIAAYRADKYNVPDKLYNSFQIIGTHKINDKNLVRLVYSRANRGPFMLDTYTDYIIPILGMNFLVEGNQNLKLPVMNMIELGVRSKVMDNLHLDLEVFHTTLDNLSQSTVDSALIWGKNVLPLHSQYKNIDLKSTQVGASLAVNYMPSSKLSIKLFGTYQQTNLEGYMPDESFTKQDSLIDITHTWTPTMYGGLICNYAPIEKLNINANVYFATTQSFNEIIDDLDQTPFKVSINSYAVLNLKASYKVYKNNSIFINARNIISDEKQFAYSEKISGLYMVGLNLEF